MVEYDARVALGIREHEPAVTTPQMTVHFGSSLGGSLGSPLGSDVIDWDARSTGEMILAWGEASLDSSISVSFPRTEQLPGDSVESDAFDWSLFVDQDDVSDALGMNLGGVTEPVVPRPRAGEPRSHGEQHDPS